MKIISSRVLQIADVEMNRMLRLDSLINILQEAAIQHTHKAGMELNSLLDSGKTWVLNKLAVNLYRLPRLDEEIEIHTWSRSLKRFKGLRDYEIFCNGAKVCSGSTVWLYLDIAKKKPARVPADYEELYGTNQEKALDIDLDAWKATALSNPEFLYTITTRLSDFDVNGHVNNAVAMQYVQTAFSRAFNGPVNLGGFRISYLREIPFEVELLQVAIQRIENIMHFEISGGEVVFVAGEAELQSNL